LGTQAVSTTSQRFPVLFEDLFKLLKGWFDNCGSLLNRVSSVPAVNIAENKNNYEVSLAACLTLTHEKFFPNFFLSLA